MSKPKNISYLLNKSYEKNESTIIKPKHNEKPFKEEEIVAQIFLALDKKKYKLLNEILISLPQGQEITGLLFKFIEELQKNDYTVSQLMAISTLLYRLSNINFASVILPKEFPNHSQVAISNIFKNKQPNQYEFIDSKIQKIVKNMITHYSLEIKNNTNYNTSNAGQIALKLKRILFSFIIDYTQSELESKPLEFRGRFKNFQEYLKYYMEHSNEIPRIVGPSPFPNSKN